MENCPICQGTLVESKAVFECEKCKRKWRQCDEGWETIPMAVNVDFSKLGLDKKYSDAVKSFGDDEPPMER